MSENFMYFCVFLFLCIFFFAFAVFSGALRKEWNLIPGIPWSDPVGNLLDLKAFPSGPLWKPASFASGDTAWKRLPTDPKWNCCTLPPEDSFQTDDTPKVRKQLSSRGWKEIHIPAVLPNNRTAHPLLGASFKAGVILKGKTLGEHTEHYADSRFQFLRISQT